MLPGPCVCARDHPVAKAEQSSLLQGCCPRAWSSAHLQTTIRCVKVTTPPSGTSQFRGSASIGLHKATPLLPTYSVRALVTSCVTGAAVRGVDTKQSSTHRLSVLVKVKRWEPLRSQSPADHRDASRVRVISL